MLIRDEPMWFYHCQTAVSSSKLSVFRDCPLLYKRMFLDGEITREKTAALNEGAGFDSLLFDGEDKFLQDYVCTPLTYTDAKTAEVKKWNGNANVCKDWTANQEAEGRTPLAKDAWQRFVSMRTAIKNHPLASALLSQGEPQVTIRRTAETFDNLQVQVRPDWISQKPIDFPNLGLSSNGLPYLLDLKTTEDFGDWWDPIDPENPRQGSPVWRYGYHRQAGFAQWVAFQDIGRTAHFLLVVEKREPFRVGVICLSGDYLELGWDAVKGDLQRLTLCRAADVWPGSPQRVLTLSPALWLHDKAAREAVATAGI